MALKLSFKGDKKKSKKKRSDTVKKSLEGGLNNLTSEERTFSINGTDTKISEIDLNQITTGWTVMNPIDIQRATPSIIDEEMGKLPIMITQTNNGKNVCLQKDKYMTPENDLKYKINFTEDIEHSTNQISLYENASTVDIKLNDIEPKGVHQVFILSDVSSIFKASNKFINNEEANLKIYSIKTTDGEYLTFDPTTNDLKMTKTITEDSIFTLKFEDDEGLLKCKLLVGNKEENNTLIVTKNNDAKIIPDSDDLLKDMSRFNIKIRRVDEYKTREIVKSKKDSLVSTFKTTSTIDGNVRQKAIELSKGGFKVTDYILKDMTKAHNEGHLNQWMLDFKEKNIHDRMA
ncbi:hypothetical protein C6P40_001215 [Pichia californica]|uniref:Uncharacterized protein n=1 Tax=Pichia californica TaxID=460514 RepID=A0A9P6WM40_9ASCO|nr:hypothetical protein C6P42_000620 [[Candida] californica]KAG0688238.1 hypothetical protein C6P40_001215 [[Candida] californica]